MGLSQKLGLSLLDIGVTWDRNYSILLREQLKSKKKNFNRNTLQIFVHPKPSNSFLKICCNFCPKSRQCPKSLRSGKPWSTDSFSATTSKPESVASEKFHEKRNNKIFEIKNNKQKSQRFYPCDNLCSLIMIIIKTVTIFHEAQINFTLLAHNSRGHRHNW